MSALDDPALSWGTEHPRLSARRPRRQQHLPRRWKLPFPKRRLAGDVATLRSRARSHDAASVELQVVAEVRLPTRRCGRSRAARDPRREQELVQRSRASPSSVTRPAALRRRTCCARRARSRTSATDLALEPLNVSRRARSSTRCSDADPTSRSPIRRRCRCRGSTLTRRRSPSWPSTTVPTSPRSLDDLARERWRSSRTATTIRTSRSPSDASSTTVRTTASERMASVTLPFANLGWYDAGVDERDARVSSARAERKRLEDKVRRGSSRRTSRPARRCCAMSCCSARTTAERRERCASRRARTRPARWASSTSSTRCAHERGAPRATRPRRPTSSARARRARARRRRGAAARDRRERHGEGAWLGRIVPVWSASCSSRGSASRCCTWCVSPLASRPRARPEAGVVYQCAMHPQVIRDEPGTARSAACGSCAATRAELALADATRRSRVRRRRTCTTKLVLRDAARSRRRPEAAATHVHGETGDGTAATAAVPGRAFVFTPEGASSWIGVKARKRRAPRARGARAGKDRLRPGRSTRGWSSTARRCARGWPLGSDAMVRATRLKLRQQDSPESLRATSRRARTIGRACCCRASAWVYAQGSASRRAVGTSPTGHCASRRRAIPDAARGRVVGVDPDPRRDHADRAMRAGIDRRRYAAAESLPTCRIASPLGDKLHAGRVTPCARLGRAPHRLRHCAARAASRRARSTWGARRRLGGGPVRPDAGEQVVTSANFLIDFRVEDPCRWPHSRAGRRDRRYRGAPPLAAAAHVH